jgi:hypothetical protein
MKKHAFPMIFLALAAFLAFLAACGEGEPSNIASQWGPIQEAINDLTGESGPIAKCVGKEDSEGCAPFPQLPLSSVTDPDDGQESSSSNGNGQPQPPGSSPGEEPSSDSQPPPPPPPPPEAGVNCPEEKEAEIKGKFNCSWDPASVISGDDATLKMQISDASCTAGKAFRLLTCGFYERVASFNVDEKIPTAGPYKEISNAAANCSEEAKVWPPSGSFVVEGLLSCEIDGTKYACSKPCAPLAINAAPAPVATGTVKFDNQDYSSSSTLYYYIGSKPTASATVTISNNDVAKCTKAKLEITTGTSYKQQSAEVDIAANGTMNLPAYAAIDGLPTVSAAQAITAKVIATCRSSEHSLAIPTPATATLVPNPSLTGTCVWNKTIAALDDDVQPSGITIKDDYSRCDGVKYSGGNVIAADWPSNNVGNWPLKITSDIRTKYSGGITDVLPSANCNTYGNLPAAGCPKLPFSLTDVGEGENTGNCEYKWDWCNGWPMEIIKKNFTKSGTLRNACVYVKGISQLATGTYHINNTSFTQNNNGNVSNLPAKKDGGYYIWVPDIVIDQGASNNKWTVTYGDWKDNPTPPDGCQEGTPTNAVAICKSHCITTDNAVISEALSISTSDVTTSPDHRPYVLMVYGNTSCDNLRWRKTDGTQQNTQCTFKVTKGTTTTSHTVAGNSNITSVAVSKWGAKVETLIEYKGGSNCPTEVKLFCD